LVFPVKEILNLFYLFPEAVNFILLQVKIIADLPFGDHGHMGFVYRVVIIDRKTKIRIENYLLNCNLAIHQITAEIFVVCFVDDFSKESIYLCNNQILSICHHLSSECLKSNTPGQVL